jgi:hypothetical protein
VPDKSVGIVWNSINVGISVTPGTGGAGDQLLTDSTGILTWTVSDTDVACSFFTTTGTDGAGLDCLSVDLCFTASTLVVGNGDTFGDSDCDVCSAINGGGSGQAVTFVSSSGGTTIWEYDYGSLNCTSGTISPFKMTVTITSTTVVVSFTGESATFTGDATGWDGVSTLTATYDSNGSTLCSWPATLSIDPS